jgi:hypothetical protein
MQHNISISIVNQPVGTPASTDNVMMLVTMGVAATTGTRPLVLDTAYLGTSLDDFYTGLGITEDYDYVNSVNVYQQVKEFFDAAGSGAYLWLVVTDETAWATYVASAVFKNLIRGTAAADLTMRAKMVGVSYKQVAAQQSAADFPTDVFSTVTALQATQEALYEEGYQFSCIVDGYNMSSTATTSTIQTAASKEAPAVSLCITGVQPNGMSGVGAALGRFARITIGHGFGAVEDGSIGVAAGYLTNGAVTEIKGTVVNVGDTLTVGVTYMVLKGPVTYNGANYSHGETFVCVTGVTVFTGTSTTVVSTASTGTVTAGHTYYVKTGEVVYNSVTYYSGDVFTAVTGVTTFTGGIVYELLATPVASLYVSDFNSLGLKQYMFMRTWFGKPGLYWNDAATCDLATKPLSIQEFNRVANRLSADLLTFLTDFMGKAITIDTTTGKASSTFVRTKEVIFYDTYINPLILSEDISGGSLTLDGTRNGVTSIDWTFVLTINGNPITGSVTGEVKFI